MLTVRLTTGHLSVGRSLGYKTGTVKVSSYFCEVSK